MMFTRLLLAFWLAIAAPLLSAAPTAGAACAHDAARADSSPTNPAHGPHHGLHHGLHHSQGADTHDGPSPSDAPAAAHADCCERAQRHEHPDASHDNTSHEDASHDDASHRCAGFACASHACAGHGCATGYSSPLMSSGLPPIAPSSSSSQPADLQSLAIAPGYHPALLRPPS
jgi:hypothetical protein